MSFSFNFLTSEEDADANDFAFVSLAAAGGDDVFGGIADVFTATSLLSPTTSLAVGTPADNAFDRETGLALFSQTLSAAGNYTLTIGLVDAGDFAIGSGLLVDDVSLAAAAVPAPSAFLLIAIGIGVFRLRKQHLV
ncbi:MAG: hypothetical protein ACPGRZ_11330 [Alphaproteobacteria bacterium]